jgi:penicillin-binding protein 1C
MLRALVHNVQNDSLHGGSTITQQLVKNTLLSPERTWRRKIREIILSLAVDALYSKDEILQYYLNEVNYGGSVHGIEEAGQWYFGKSAKDLSLAESAFLAGLPQAPSLYSPFGVNPQRAVDREKEVLRRMEEDHYISAAQRAEAEQQKLVFTTGTYDIKAPHFVMYVRNILAEKFGEDMVTQGGLNVYTTLDINEQASAEAAVKNEIARLGRINVTNGAAMVTDPRSGQILAMVGSRDYFDTAHDGQVNVTLRSRQPGSSIKPLTYSLAFEHGYTPSTTIQDQPVSYSAPGAPPYAPKNYDGRFHGQVTLREALGSSYNVPAVRLLADLGVPSLVDKGRALGITTWDEASASRFGLALTLGSGEVRMIDMASVYGTFANGGYTVTPQPLLLVTNYNGQVLYRNPCADATEPCGARRTLSALAAYEITSVLSDNGARTPAFGPNSQLYFPGQQIAVKTGTTNVLRDNWTIGYTPERVVLTWVGNNDNKPMSAVASGVTGASPIWHTIMAGLIKDQRIAFTLPSSLEQVKICRLTGTLACAECPQITTEIYPIGMTAHLP